MKKSSAIFLFLLLMFAYKTCYAHQSGVSFLELNAASAPHNKLLTGRWKIAVLDAQIALGLDDDQNNLITWGEILANSHRIGQFAKASIKLQQNNNDCSIAKKDLMLERLNNGLYIVVDLQFSCLSVDAKAITLNYTPMVNIDNSHNGVINYKTRHSDSVAILDQHNTQYELPVESNQRVASFFRFLRQGIWHIAIGTDHILFLLALLLASIVHHKNNQTPVSNSLTPILKDIIKVVTVFTVAHSISLIAASMRWFVLPTAFVETTIAVSVALGGFLILVPIKPGYRLGLVFCFGLIHGFGFANVLHDLLVSQQTLVLGTLGFNIGVEIGQLIIVLLALPAFYFARRYEPCKIVLLPTSALLIVFTGTFWAIERSVM